MSDRPRHGRRSVQQRDGTELGTSAYRRGVNPTMFWDEDALVFGLALHRAKLSWKAIGTILGCSPGNASKHIMAEINRRAAFLAPPLSALLDALDSEWDAAFPDGEAIEPEASYHMSWIFDRRRWELERLACDVAVDFLGPRGEEALDRARRGA